MEELTKIINFAYIYDYDDISKIESSTEEEIKSSRSLDVFQLEVPDTHWLDWAIQDYAKIALTDNDDEELLVFAWAEGAIEYGKYAKLYKQVKVVYDFELLENKEEVLGEL